MIRRKKQIKRKNPNREIKIIFLDHDGVLVPNSFDDLEQEFSSACVYILNEILLETDAQIIVSSDWRLHYDLRALCEIYKNNDIVRCPISITPDLWTKNSDVKDLEKLRAKEILMWLKDKNIDKWVAIDDMNLPLKNFVQTDSKKGLVEKGIKNKILSYLI